MRLVSTLKMASLASDPQIFNDGEVYFNTVEKTVRLASDGAWINMINTTNLETSFLREANAPSTSLRYC